MSGSKGNFFEVEDFDLSVGRRELSEVQKEILQNVWAEGPKHFRHPPSLSKYPPDITNQSSQKPNEKNSQLYCRLRDWLKGLHHTQEQAWKGSHKSEWKQLPEVDRYAWKHLRSDASPRHGRIGLDGKVRREQRFYIRRHVSWHVAIRLAQTSGMCSYVVLRKWVQNAAIYGYLWHYIPMSHPKSVDLKCWPYPCKRGSKVSQRLNVKT